MTPELLRKINTLTKYPSIPTFHALGERGALLEEVVEMGPDIVVTEKVDGTNSRVVCLPPEVSSRAFVIGSREEFLTAQGDLVRNPALGIVEASLPFARDVSAREQGADPISLAHGADSCVALEGALAVVFFFETYGGKIGRAAKEYSSDRSVGLRLFDVAVVPVSLAEGRSREELSAWREAGGQTFLAEDELVSVAAAAGMALAPRLSADPLPRGIDEAHGWLRATLPKSGVALDVSAGGNPEGTVVRTRDRRKIAKLRFEDYARHAKRLVRKR